MNDKSETFGQLSAGTESRAEQLFLLFLVFAFFLTACKPTQPQPAVQAVNMDCAERWKQQQADKTEELEFSITLDKSQYRVDELIFSTLALKNTSLKPVWVNNRMLVNHDFIERFGEVYFVIVAPWNEVAVLSAKINAGESEKKYFVLLDPSEKVETLSEGIMYYVFTSKTEQSGSTYFPEGKYCMWAMYHNQTDPGLDGMVWKGSIKSNFVEFDVTK